MNITCAYCGKTVGVPWSPGYYSTVYKVHQKRGGIDMDQYDEAWICVDCFSRIEEVLGDLYDDMQQE